jgi:hypothetical protein
MAEIVDHELMEHVSGLKCYIKDTTELLQKQNKIPKPLPGNYIMFCGAGTAYPSGERNFTHSFRGVRVAIFLFYVNVL